MTYRRCMAKGCGHFHEKKLPACPKCDTPSPAYNSHLYGAKLNNHLYGMAESNGKQGYMSAYQAAKEHVGQIL